jgi:hypothetical protein
MGRIAALLASTVTLSLTVFLFSRSAAADTPLQVGFAEADITPQLGDKPVHMAGFGQNRKATAIHDPLKARVVVLKHGERKIALVSVDVVGLFHASAERVRAALPGFSYVLVSSTHNHEGPDTLGLWGPNPFKSGLDPEYLKQLEAKIVQAVKDADQNAVAATARIATANAPELLHDGREPYIKHDELVVLEFTGVKSQQLAGLVVQWNCHPETLDSKNTELSADFVGYTVKELQEKQRCPVVYLTGTVGGLLTSLKVPIQDADGKPLADGTFAKTERFGRLVGQAAVKALEKAKPLSLGPIQARSKDVYLPLENKAYVLGWQLGVLQRQAYLWTGDATKAEPAPAKEFKQPLCIRTEVAWLRLGELDIAAIPGEIYPELVLDKVQDPADPNADFPDAPIEPAIYKQLAGSYRMIVGLANDEIGYILPKRQWDEKAPFCYGRPKAQYGEGNSVGPEAAPILCRAFAELVKGRK